MLIARPPEYDPEQEKAASSHCQGHQWHCVQPGNQPYEGSMILLSRNRKGNLPSTIVIIIDISISHQLYYLKMGKALVTMAWTTSPPPTILPTAPLRCRVLLSWGPIADAQEGEEWGCYTRAG